MTKCPTGMAFTRRGKSARQPAIRRFRNLVLAATAIACLAGGAFGAWAQTGYDRGKPGTWDNSKAKAKIMEHYRAKLEVKDDAEWNIIQERIQNVLRAEHEFQAVLLAAQHKSHSSGQGTAAKGHAGQDRAHEGDAESEVRALQELVKAKAPAHEIKPRLARVREILRGRQDKLAAAREDLRAVLSARQEAVALLSGLLR